MRKLREGVHYQQREVDPESPAALEAKIAAVEAALNPGYPVELTEPERQDLEKTATTLKTMLQNRQTKPAQAPSSSPTAAGLHS